MTRFLARHSPLVILAGLCVGMTFLSPVFGSADNLKSVALRTSVDGIIAVGQVMVIIAGGIDLSVGSVGALAGVVAALLMKNHGIPVPLCVLAGMLTGLACGTVNGVLTAKGRIPSFIATLGMMLAARGAALLISGATPIPVGAFDRFRYLGGARGWWIPVVITAAVAVVFTVALLFTRHGRALYATGGNATGARLSGVNVNAVRIGAFMLCGLLTGFAGVMHASRVTVADPTTLEGAELKAVSACVMGGASLAGGEGGAIGALAGALIMSVLVNFCNLRGYNTHWQNVLIGALIVVLVLYDNARKRKMGLLKE